MITVTMEFEDEKEAGDALAWRETLLVLQDTIENLRRVYKYEKNSEEISKFAEDLRADLIAECNERGIRWE